MEKKITQIKKKKTPCQKKMAQSWQKNQTPQTPQITQIKKKTPQIIEKIKKS